MDQPKWHSNERVNIADFRRGTGGLAMLDQIREARSLMLPPGRTTGMANVGARVLRGFDASIPGGAGVGTTVLIEDGWGIFPITDSDGTVHHGLVFGDVAPTSYVINFSVAGAGTYAVFVRPLLTDSDYENRVFWNAAGPTEEIDNVATYRTLTWEYVVQDSSLSPPGADYVKLYEVVVAAGPVVSAITEFRHLFFEGSAHGTDGYAHEWGGGTTRNDDRATYGIGDFNMWVQAIRRQLADVIGDPIGASYHKWYVAPPIELTALGLEHYAGSDGATLRGRHRLVTFGAAGAQHRIASLGLDTYTITSIDQADSAVVRVENVAGSGQLLFQPRGEGNAMQDGDEFVITIGANDVWQTFDRYSAENYAVGLFAEGVGLASLKMRMGAQTPAGSKGMELGEAGAAYMVSMTSIDIMLPWMTMLQSATPAWLLDGPAAGNVGDPAAEAGYTFLKTAGAQASKLQILEFRDFPTRSNLLAIDVLWRQGASGGGGAEMRLYAGRHTLTASDPADTHNTGQDCAVGFLFSVKSLNSVTDYVQYAPSALTTETRRFKPNQNNTAWDRKTDKLVVALLSPAIAQQCYVYGIKTRWSYNDISPWPTL